MPSENTIKIIIMQIPNKAKKKIFYQKLCSLLNSSAMALNKRVVHKIFLHDINLARTSVKRRVCSNLRKKLLNESTNNIFLYQKLPREKKMEKNRSKR